jgi:hypothetical protein
VVVGLQLLTLLVLLLPLLQLLTVLLLLALLLQSTSNLPLGMPFPMNGQWRALQCISNRRRASNWQFVQPG